MESIWGLICHSLHHVVERSSGRKNNVGRVVHIRLTINYRIYKGEGSLMGTRSRSKDEMMNKEG